MIESNKAIHAAILLLLLLLIGGCATLPDNHARSRSYAYTDTADTALGKSVAAELRTHPSQSGLLLLGSGLDAFVARAVLADRAERSIDAQYYLLHNDLTGNLFVDRLIKAADRGVRVRLLLDDIDFGGKDQGLAVLDSHSNIEIRLFHPFSRKSLRGPQFDSRSGEVTHRMHNKSFTVDTQATIIGGRNIGDEYFDADPKLAFGDIDLLAIGPVVEEVSSAFDLYWNSALAYPESTLIPDRPTTEAIEADRQQLEQYIAEHGDSAYLQALRDSNLANALRTDSVHFHWGEATAIYDHPEKVLHESDRKDLHLAPDLSPILHRSKEELIIFSAYFVPTEKGVEALRRLSRRGVHVRILTNSLASNDVPIVHAGYAKYRKPLLRAGIELYELNKKIPDAERKSKRHNVSSNASLHAKAFVVDRKKAFIGSVNFDPRSLHENTEIGILLTAPAIARKLAGWFDRIVARHAFRLELQIDEDGDEQIRWHGLVDAKKRVFDVDPYTGFWYRLGLDIIGILPIESEL